MCDITAVNITDDTCSVDCRNPELNGLYFGVFQVVFPVLIATGLVFNVVNLIVLTRPRMMNKIYRWLRALAVVDITLCILTVPVCIANSGHTPSSYALAKYHSMFGWSLSIGSQIVSFYLMVWFAYDRYLAVCCHEKYPKSLRYEVYRKKLVCTVLLVVALYLPTMFIGNVCTIKGEWLPLDGYSTVEQQWYKAYSWIREIFSRVVPLGLITVFNIKIAMRLKQLRDVRDGFANGVSPARREKEQRLVVLLFWVTALFYVYNTPVAIYYLVFLNHDLVQKDQEHHVLTFGVISNLIQMIGNVSNFTLYFLINPEFHKTLQSLYCSSKPVACDESKMDFSPEKPSRPQITIEQTISQCHIIDDLSDSGYGIGPAAVDQPDATY